MFIAFLGLDNAELFKRATGFVRFREINGWHFFSCSFWNFDYWLFICEECYRRFLIGILIFDSIGIPLGVTELPSGMNNILVPPSVSQVASVCGV